MSTATKISAYGTALALIAGGGYAIGNAAGPLSVTAPSGHGEAHTGNVAPASIDQPGGLASSRNGYTLTPTTSTLMPGTNGTYSYRITGPDGGPITGFDVEHDKRMHLIVVRRDTTGFQHVHPEMAPDGTWSVPLSVPAAGTYRVFADFTPTGGQGTTLGIDVDAPGDYQPVGHPPTRIAQVDGYTAELSGELVPGRGSPVTLAISKNGMPVTDLQPYLAAYGHLVALRDGDLAYLHVHPEGSPGDGRTPAGPTVQFVAEVPSAGTYRMFLDFQHDGVVRTAEFTVPAGTTGTAPHQNPTAPAEPPVTAQIPTSPPADGGHGAGH